MCCVHLTASLGSHVAAAKTVGGGRGGCYSQALTPLLMMQAMSAHTSPFTCRMREASSRPKREYKPKSRESFDLGEPEQSNGGFPAPKISGKVLEEPCFPRASETGPLWGSPSLLPPPSPLQKGPDMGPGPTSALPAHLCVLFASSFVIFPIFRQAHPDPQQEHA